MPRLKQGVKREPGYQFTSDGKLHERWTCPVCDIEWDLLEEEAENEQLANDKSTRGESERVAG